MKKLITLLFSIFISINSYSGIFSETICFETDGKNVVFLPKETNPYTGIYLCKYDNGQKEKEGRYKDGRLIGKWTVWYNNGQKWHEGNYKDGKKIGEWNWWNKKGQKVRQKNYKNGKLDGKLIEWFQINGEIKREENYKNGKIIEKLKIVTDMKIPISVNNIMGFPFETRELAFETIELNRHIESDGLNAYTFVPFHGVPLRKLSEDNNMVEKGKIVRSLMNLTMLDQPQFPKEEIEGIRRCFVLYVKMPKDRWDDIRKAESLTPEGDKIWKSLKKECEKYMNYGDHDATEVVDMVDFEK